MKAALLLALALTTAADEPETSALIARLGSPAAADRDSAAAALEAKGRAAMPALRAAAHDSRDAEVRSRAAKLLARIEHEVLTRPTMVALDVRDQPVGEALKALAEKNQFDLAGELDDIRENLLRKVSLRVEKPVPLLTALDRLCNASGLSFGYRSGTPLAPPKYPFSNPLTIAPARTEGPASDSGPFRVQILSVGYTLQRYRFFDRDAGQDDERYLDEHSFLSLVVVAEPRLMLKAAGGVKILEAIDDRGQSLILPAAPDGERMTRTPYPAAAMETRADLKPEGRDGGTIRRIRGSIPVRIVELRPGPHTIPLADSQGKSFDGPDATLTVESLQLDPKGPKGMSLRIRIRSKFDDLEIEPDEPAGPGPTPPGSYPYPFLDRQAVMLDANGRKLMGWGTGTKRLGPKEALLSSNYFLREESPMIPAKLLFYGIIRTTAEIPFEFRDVPLP